MHDLFDVTATHWTPAIVAVEEMCCALEACRHVLAGQDQRVLAEIEANDACVGGRRRLGALVLDVYVRTDALVTAKLVAIASRTLE